MVPSRGAGTVPSVVGGDVAPVAFTGLEAGGGGVQEPVRPAYRGRSGEPSDALVRREHLRNLLGAASRRSLYRCHTLRDSGDHLLPLVQPRLLTNYLQQRPPPRLRL